jgi:hypothetical protein
VVDIPVVGSLEEGNLEEDIPVVDIRGVGSLEEDILMVRGKLSLLQERASDAYVRTEWPIVP